MSKRDFNNLTLRYGCSPVNLMYIFRTPFPKNPSGELFLILTLISYPCYRKELNLR